MFFLDFWILVSWWVVRLATIQYLFYLLVTVLLPVSIVYFGAAPVRATVSECIVLHENHDIGTVHNMCGTSPIAMSK